MKPIKNILLFTFSFLLFNSSFSQDPQFTQTFAGMTYTNPSFCGSDTSGTFYIAHRNQWPKLSGTYQTTIAGWQQYISQLNSYAGLHYLYDISGAMTTHRFSTVYAQNIKIKKLLLRPSIEATIFQKSIDWSQLTFGDMIDPRRGFVYQTGAVPIGGSISNVDFSAGLLANFYNISLGISMHHLTEPDESLIYGNSLLPMKIGFHAGYDILYMYGNNLIFNFQPYLIFYNQAQFKNLNFGLNTKVNDFLLGFNYRRNDSYAFMAGFTKWKARISYSYEITNSNLGNENTGGTHEFTLSYRFWKCKAHKKYLKGNINAFDLS